MQSGEFEGVYFWFPKCKDGELNGHLVKVGRSKDVVKRASNIQTSSPYILQQLWMLQIDGWSASALEDRMHNDLNRYHYHHEWFQIPTLHWQFFVRTIHWYFDELPLLECVIDKGPLLGIYGPDGLRPDMVEGIVEKAASRALSEANA